MERIIINTHAAPAAPAAPKATVGEWNIVGKTGVSAMHLVLVRPTKALIIDKAEKNPDVANADGTFALSTEYDLLTNTYRPLKLITNTFCSAGSFFENGTLAEAGGAEVAFGHKEGFQSLRLFDACDDKTCDWVEYPGYLNSNRWYTTMTSLPDGRVFILGGSTKATGVNKQDIQNPTFEFLPNSGVEAPKAPMQFLIDTFPYNLYVTVIVVPGPPEQNWLFLAANKKAQIWDFGTQKTVKQLPDIPGGPRTYPLTAATTLLPLSYENNYAPEVLICGGGTDIVPAAPTENTCVRLNLVEANGVWDQEEFGGMPKGRVMGDPVHLPDGKVLIVNGAAVGFAGYDRGPPENRINVASEPTFTPLVYDPKAAKGARWAKWADSTVIRGYHSVATLIPDGTVFVAGSNPNEIFTPPYLLNGTPRPTILSVAGLKELNGINPIPVTFGQLVTVTIQISATAVPDDIIVSLVHMGFITHSQHMSSRYIRLKVENLIPTDIGYAIDVTMPPNGNMFPPGRHHYLFVTYKGTPAASAVEVKLQKAAT
nr:5266_t:CDS:2 [Entrophospora candida]